MAEKKRQNKQGQGVKWGGFLLTQVPSHQIGVVEILHAQSNDVDEFLYDLHELHCSRIDLDKMRETQRHVQGQQCCHDSINDKWMEHKIQMILYLYIYMKW